MRAVGVKHFPGPIPGSTLLVFEGASVETVSLGGVEHRVITAKAMALIEDMAQKGTVYRVCLGATCSYLVTVKQRAPLRKS